MSPGPASAVPSEYIVFGHAVEAFFKILPPLSPRALERFHAAGVKPEGPFLPGYTTEQMQNLEEIAAEELFPGTERRRALRRVGEMQVEGYASTTLGSALFTLLKLLGRKRSLERITRSWRSANNYIDATVSQVEADVFDVHVNFVGRNPEPCLGILFGALTASGQPPKAITVHQFDPPACVYRIDWR